MYEQGVCINSADRACGPASYVVDPYNFDVNSEIEYVWFCAACLQNRKDDI